MFQSAAQTTASHRESVGHRPLRKKRGVIAAALGGALALASTGLGTGPIETPAYDVLVEHDGWEIRRYEPRIEAQVVVTAPTYQEAASEGFRVLAAFIFGDNETAASVEMTAPVTASEQGASEQIAMTAPVGASEDADGVWTIAFTMPSEFTTETLPRPRDARVSIVERPGGTWAAARFSGRAARQHLSVRAMLEAAIETQGLRAAGAPEVAQYNPPWTPGPMRRNEVLIPVAPVPASS